MGTKSALAALLSTRPSYLWQGPGAHVKARRSGGTRGASDRSPPAPLGGTRPAVPARGAALASSFVSAAPRALSRLIKPKRVLACRGDRTALGLFPVS